MKQAGWIIAVILMVVVIMNQITIREYKATCKDYRKAIAIYERVFFDE